MYPPTLYLTDCTDVNAQARLGTRISALMGRPPMVLPLTGPDPEATASLTLLDVLRATDALGESGNPTVILLNIAPRDGTWHNGAPFCYFHYGHHLVLSTYHPRVLELCRRHLGVTQVDLTDIETVLRAAASSWATLGAAEIEAIAATQFRSLWYLPLLAKWVLDGQPVPTETREIPAGSEDGPVVVHVVDNFGNGKLNRSGEAVGFSPGARVSVTVESETGPVAAAATCYARLSDVPVGELGLVRGSSGDGFVELVVGCGSAARDLGLREGTLVTIEPVSTAVAVG